MSELIVCATDFSPQSEAALAWATALARRDGGHVDLVHVARPYQEDSRTLVFEDSLVDADQVRLALEQLREAARKLSQETGVSVRPQVLRGEPHVKLLEYARQEDARLVVLGTCGLQALDRLILGSVAERTVRAADRPVVLVPRAQVPNPWRPDASRAPRVVAGLGPSDDVALLRFVADLRREGACDVTCTHLYWPLVEYARLGLGGPRDPVTPDPDVVKNLEPGLRQKIGNLPGRGQITLDIRPAWGDTTANLMVAVEESGADLLVIGIDHRHSSGLPFSRSVAERLARSSRYVPIACVPVEHVAAPKAVPSIHVVLAVTDFSELGNAAVRHAYALLRGRGGVVELLHVHEHALPTPPYAYDIPEWKLSDVERAGLAKELRSLVPEEAASLGVTTHVSVVDGGRAAEAIVQAAERLNTDVICMASHGRSGIARTILGSVAGEVVQRSKKPVYVVRDGR
jgi:nucleotide-binding universal stress UspA family protein